MHSALMCHECQWLCSRYPSLHHRTGRARSWDLLNGGIHEMESVADQEAAGSRMKSCWKESHGTYFLTGSSGSRGSSHQILEKNLDKTSSCKLVPPFAKKNIRMNMQNANIHALGHVQPWIKKPLRTLSVYWNIVSRRSSLRIQGGLPVTPHGDDDPKFKTPSQHFVV
jgi:hypothetical protein